MPIKDEIQFAKNPEPRCPVVLLLDTSASMHGLPIEELNDGLNVFKQSLEEDKLASQRVEVAIITFGPVQMSQDFVSPNHWIPERYNADDMTPMGEAINYALDILEDRKQTYKNNGIQYYRPWVFLITDGAPNDEWLLPTKRLKEAFNQNKLQFFAVAVKDADIEILKQIAPNPAFPPVALNGLDFKPMFQWLSSSLSSVSHSTPGCGQVEIERPVWGKIAT